jgi:hypothetical protein
MSGHVRRQGLEPRTVALQSFAEWSDSYAAGEVLVRRGSTMEGLVTSLGEAL